MQEMLLIKAKNGDKAAENEVVQNNMGLVYMIVKRFLNRGYEAEDLAQIGAIGLIKAVRRFDTSYDVQFSTYAVPMIMGEIRRFIRDNGSIKVSRSVKELAMAAYRAKEEIENTEGHEATISEIASKLEKDPEDVIYAMNAAAEPKSICSYDSDGNEINITDKIAAEEFENRVIDKITIENLLENISERERLILIYRYFKGKTQSEIASMLSLSQVQISRIEKSVIKKLREKYNGE